MALIEEKKGKVLIDGVEVKKGKFYILVFNNKTKQPLLDNIRSVLLKNEVRHLVLYKDPKEESKSPTEHRDEGYLVSEVKTLDQYLSEDYPIKSISAAQEILMKLFKISFLIAGIIFAFSVAVMLIKIALS